MPHAKHQLTRLIVGLVNGTEGQDAGPLLLVGGAIWLTNYHAGTVSRIELNDLPDECRATGGT